jgi:thioredoxin-like negative regulator of GroEL
MLEPKMRADLVAHFVTKGLPEAASKIIEAAPEDEKPALRESLTKNIPAEPLPPPKLLASLQGNLTDDKGELGQIQLLLSEKKWNDASMGIEKLAPGPNRMRAVLALLTRPMPATEIHIRLTEAEGWLAKCSETSAVKEPLAILIADLYMQMNNPKEALANYPSAPQPENQGWVALMRATAMSKLGQNDDAKRVLSESASVPEFLAYRQSLANQLNR